MFLGQHLLAHKSNLAIVCNTNPTWPLYSTVLEDQRYVGYKYLAGIAPLCWHIQYTNHKSSFTSIHVLDILQYIKW